ncbi:DUF4835 family protein [Capnocytophaga gingivalis]|uniref:type IX secretion system protein PorD n=1 Tax=Capnocytophaga gingivalis TaxID=1017 RepID=UPI0028E99637|nr:DUF4835 family protein [Capnocytophaga gingivalis]
MRKLILLCLFIFTMTANAQELSCRVTVNTQRINQTNQRAFVTLQRALQEFVNKTQWTDIKARENERINCSFVLTLSSYENNNFKADLQVQASRPVYGSTYPTPLINYQEKDITFSYLENEPIYFNPNTFTSNLSSIIAYYALIIIGLDADTFAPNGGNPYFEQALAVVLNAQSSSDSAWQQNGSNNRWQMVTDLLAEDFVGFHKALYTYHRQGLDLMAQDIQKGKNQIGAALLELSQINNSRINRFVSQLFFDAKADEISQLLSGGKPLDKKEEVRAVLLKLAPTRAQEWNQIK